MVPFPGNVPSAYCEPQAFHVHLWFAINHWALLYYSCIEASVSSCPDRVWFPSSTACSPNLPISLNCRKTDLTFLAIDQPHLFTFLHGCRKKTVSSTVPFPIVRNAQALRVPESTLRGRREGKSTHRKTRRHIRWEVQGAWLPRYYETNFETSGQVNNYR